MAQYRIDTNQFLNNGNTIYEVVMFADQDGNIVNSFGPASNIIIAANNLVGYTGVHKYGGVFGTSTSGNSTIWTSAEESGINLYPWDLEANTVTIASTSAVDGANTVIVEGLNANYDYLSESITLNGSSDVTGSQQFLRVNRAYMANTTNIGRIDIKNSGNDVIVSAIKASTGQTMQCFYTIPRNKTGYLFNLNASASKNQETTVSMFQRPFNGAFRVAATMSLHQNNQQLDFPVPVKFTQKTDIDLRVNSTSNATISADFTIILVDNSV